MLSHLQIINKQQLNKLFLNDENLFLTHKKLKITCFFHYNILS